MSQHRSSRFLQSLCVLAGVGVFAATPAAAQELETFSSYHGERCVGLDAEFPVADRAALQRELPEGWRARDSRTFKTPTVALIIAHCPKLSVDNAATADGGFAQIFTAIVPPEGGAHGFMLREYANHAGYAESSRRAGFAGGLAPLDVTVTRAPTGDILDGRASVAAGPGESFELEVQSPLPDALGQFVPTATSSAATGRRDWPRWRRGGRRRAT